MVANLAKIFQKPVERSLDGVFLLSSYQPSSTHEDAYLKIRRKENRLLHDDDVRRLPNVSQNFPHSQEWNLRKQTADYFIHLLSTKKGPRLVLDLGCGNGWFSAKMASMPHVNVIGVDLNLPELQQAQRLFGSEKIIFCYADITDDLFLPEQFDIITLNASLQYFTSISQLFTILLKHLKADGEIHILDTPFYETHDVDAAKMRTEKYYLNMDSPEMIAHYFHHTYQDLNPYSPIIVKEKRFIWKRIFGMSQNRFPKIIVKKKVSY